MNKKNTQPPQQEFLLGAIETLGMSRVDFAKRISVPKKTLDKWLAAEGTSDQRAMPEMAWAYIKEILENNEK
jgi:DNA-binding transcriptional regulator YiaG